MVWVNLLPWRERQRAVRCRRGGAVLLAITVAGGALLMMFGLLLAAENQRWQQQIEARQAALTQADTLAQQLAQAQQHYQALLTRQQRQQRQQQLNQHWLAFMQALPQLMPERLWLTRFTQARSAIHISGVSQRLDDVDILRQQLLMQPLLQQISMGGIERLSDGGLQFSLHAALHAEVNDE